jgi:hypothetical protein
MDVKMRFILACVNCGSHVGLDGLQFKISIPRYIIDAIGLT